MSHEHLPNHITDLLYAEECGLLRDRLGRAVKRMMHIGVAGEFEHGLLRFRVEKDRIRHAFEPPLRSPGPTEGEVVLGQDVQGNWIRCPLQHFNEPSLTVSSTGSGKTTKSRFLILQLARLVRGLWLFDFRKREFGILQPYLQRIGVELTIVRARQMRLNPLQVPRYTRPQDFASVLADALVGILKLPQRAAKLLHLQLLNLYRVSGVLDGGKLYPTLFDLRESVAADKTAHAESRSAIVASLDPLLFSIGNTLRYRRGWATDDLSRMHLAFDLSGVSDTEQNLLLNSLLLAEFRSRIDQNISNPKMNLLIVCDEAARLCSNGDSSIAEWIGLIRGTGTGIDLSVQSADITRSVISNTPSKFLGRCACANDYDTIGAAMGLTADQRRWLATNLVPGLFVGSLGQGPLRRPFLFSVPNMHVNRHNHAGRFGDSGSDELHSDDHSSGLLAHLPTVEATEFVNWSPDKRLKVGEPVPAMQPVQSNPLDAAVLRLLKTIADSPGKPSSWYPKNAGMSPRKVVAARQQLVQDGLIRETVLQTKSRGRSAIVLTLTDKATEFLSSVSDDQAEGGMRE